MNREVQVRICERLGVKIPGATRLIVFNEASLRRHLKLFVEYYQQSRTHLSLEKDAPESRPVQSLEAGRV